MLTTRFKLICLVTIAFFSSITTISAEEMVLDTALFESAPLFMKTKNGEYTGICVDLMKEMEKVSNIRFNYKPEFIPPKRLAFWAIAGRYDVMLCITRIKAFEKFADYLDTPLFEYDHALMTKVDDSVTISSVDDIRDLGKNGKLLVMPGRSTAILLEEIDGLIIDDGAKSMNSILKKLEKKRGRFVVSNSIQLMWLMKKKEYQGKYKLLPFSFQKSTMHIVFSKVAGDENEIKAVNQALDKLIKAGKLKQIIKKYR